MRSLFLPCSPCAGKGRPEAIGGIEGTIILFLSFWSFFSHFFCSCLKVGLGILELAVAGKTAAVN